MLEKHNYSNFKELSNIHLITGIPRSGTTLLSNMLNSQENVVVSAEPGGILLEDEATISEHLEHCLSQIKKWHQQAKIEGTVYTRHIDGIIPDNWVSKNINLNNKQPELGNVAINNKIESNFLFFIKDPGAFTALLPALVNVPIKTSALIRNPLAILASWNSSHFPVYNGRFPPAEKIDKELECKLNETDDRIARQLILLFWSRY